MYKPNTNGIYFFFSVALILESMLIRCVGGGLRIFMDLYHCSRHANFVLNVGQYQKFI